jgi:uncharacterized phage protein (TIGR02220 family)
MCTAEAFVSLSFPARRFLILLWTECDDQGSFEWKPKQLKMELLPADSIDIEELLCELVEWNCVMQYEMNGKQYGAVRNFCRYQRPKKPNAIFPQSEAVKAYCCCGSSEPVGNQYGTGGENAEQMEDGEEEVKGGEISLSGTPDDVLPEDVGKSDEVRALNQKARPIIDYLNEKTSSRFKHVDSQLKFLRGRLGEGVTHEELCRVVDFKVAEWSGTDMERFLRPATLFNATKYQGYAERAAKWDAIGRPPPKRDAKEVKQEHLSKSMADRFIERKQRRTA